MRTAAVLGPSLSAGAEGCSPTPSPAWWMDRPSASARSKRGQTLASSLVPWTGGGSEGSDPVRKRALPRRKVGAGSPGAAKSSLRDPARHGGKVYPSAGRASETTEQGVLRALRDKVRGHRARAGTPCSSLRGPAARSRVTHRACNVYTPKTRIRRFPQPAAAEQPRIDAPRGTRFNCGPRHRKGACPWPTRPSSPRPRGASA
jgi:hypothetical protein